MVFQFAGGVFFPLQVAERQVGGAQNREANLGKEKLAKRITMVSKSPKDRSPSKWTKLNGL